MRKKYIIVLFILIIRICSTASTIFNYSSIGTRENPIKIDRFHFRQTLNHLKQDSRKFNQRYAIAITYYKKSGPAFLNLWGSESMDEGYEFSNDVLAYAKHLNAICFSLEHRFYGRSWPENVYEAEHLSTTQALLDIVNFIDGMTKEFHLPKDTKWIIFGCSYAGKLAAWSRLKYPHIIHGAVASSAPILAKVNYFEFDQIVEESLKSYDPRCIESITLAFEEIAHLVDTAEIRQHISKMFYLGEAFNTTDRIKKKIVRSMRVLFGEVVKYAGHYPISIPSLCRIMTNYNGTKLAALAEITKMHIEFEGNDKTRLFGKSQNHSAKDEDRKGQAAKEIYARLYQSCTEFGHFSSYTNVTYLSPVKHLLMPIEQQIEFRCTKLLRLNFSIQTLTEKVGQTNLQYGGFNFNVSNTIFIHGSLDPWYKAGLYKKANASLYETIFIKGSHYTKFFPRLVSFNVYDNLIVYGNLGTSHCADTYRPRNTDIPELKNARIKVFETIKSWLNNTSTSENSRK